MKITRRKLLLSAAAAPVLWKCATETKALPRLVVFEGNSLTALNASWVTICWPSLLMKRPSLAQHRLAGINVAVGGDGILQAAERAPIYVDPLAPIGGVVVLWEGTNGLGQSGYDAALTYRQHRDYCLERKKAGWRVVIGTIANRKYGTPPNPDPRHEPARLEFNRLIRESWRGFADALLDIGSDVKLGQPTSADNPRYFRDGIHLTADGASRVADLAEGVIGALFSSIYLPRAGALDSPIATSASQPAPTR